MGGLKLTCQGVEGVAKAGGARACGPDCDEVNFRFLRRMMWLTTIHSVWGKSS